MVSSAFSLYSDDSIVNVTPMYAGFSNTVGNVNDAITFLSRLFYLVMDTDDCEIIHMNYSQTDDMDFTATFGD